MSQPVIMFNPTDEIIEFMYDHQTYVFRPGEKKILNREPADHAIRFMNTGLQIYDGLNETVASDSALAYDKMPWKKVVSIASKRGLFKPGMTKEDVYKELNDADAKGV